MQPLLVLNEEHDPTAKARVLCLYRQCVKYTFFTWFKSFSGCNRHLFRRGNGGRERKSKRGKNPLVPQRQFLFQPAPHWKGNKAASHSLKRQTFLSPSFTTRNCNTPSLLNTSKKEKKRDFVQVSGSAPCIHRVPTQSAGSSPCLLLQRRLVLAVPPLLKDASEF